MAVQLTEKGAVIVREPMRGHGKTLTSLFVLSAFTTVSLTGCTTAWRDSGSFYRTTQTKLTIESDPQGKAYVNGQYVGDTPVSTPLDYEQEIKRRTRKVSYWTTQPALALGLSLVSLGLYIPFSFSPVDIETEQEPSGTFRNNQFTVLIHSVGYRDWQDTILCLGQDSMSLRPVLIKPD